MVSHKTTCFPPAPHFSRARVIFFSCDFQIYELQIELQMAEAKSCESQVQTSGAVWDPLSLPYGEPLFELQEASNEKLLDLCTPLAVCILFFHLNHVFVSIL